MVFLMLSVSYVMNIHLSLSTLTGKNTNLGDSSSSSWKSPFGSESLQWRATDGENTNKNKENNNMVCKSAEDARNSPPATKHFLQWDFATLLQSLNIFVFEVRTQRKTAGF